MQTKLLQLEQRIAELEALATEITELVRKYVAGDDVQPALNIKGQSWYRGGRELLVQQDYSGQKEFDNIWATVMKDVIEGNVLTDALSAGNYFPQAFRAARALLAAVVDEIRSRELPVKSQLSLAVSTDEFEKALELLGASNDEVIIRASGVVARVALERHLFTVADTHSITIQVNPPNKKKPEAQDVLNTLAKHNVITPIQKSELEGLFKVGNACAHPGERITSRDVGRLINNGRELASLII